MSEVANTGESSSLESAPVPSCDRRGTGDRPGWRRAVLLVLLAGVGLTGGCDAIISISGGQPAASMTVSASSVELNTRVRVDAKGSTASRGPLVYRWSLEETPTGSTARIRPRDSVEAAFRVDRPGTYEIRLEVTDYHGRASTARTVVGQQRSSQADVGP